MIKKVPLILMCLGMSVAVLLLYYGFYLLGVQTGYRDGFCDGEESGKYTGYLEGLLAGREESAGRISQLLEEVEIMRTGGIKEWYSIEELECWLEKDPVSKRQYEPYVYDCDNFARDLADSAARDNRLIGIWKETSDNRSHLSNFAIIGNTVYAIEPQTDAVKEINYVDKYFGGQ